MKKVVLKYKVGEVVKERSPKALAEQIETILLKPDYQKTLKKASKKLTWENESEKLAAIYNDLL